MEQQQLKQDHATNILAFMQKMQGLGIKAKFSRIEEGPIITGYYYTPDAGTPISKLLKHEEDFAQAAKVDSVSVQRITGDVVIFVPNKERKTIHFYDSAWYCYTQRCNYEIPISLGVDFLGNKSIIDLTGQPHILLAGQTGSGKSVFLANIIATLAICKSMSELVFSFIDTKRLDLPLFSELPQVIELAKDLNDARSLFVNILSECRTRYKNLEMKRVRSIKEWNEKNPENKYHYHVLIIDELADLLDQDSAMISGMSKKERTLLNIQSIPELLQQLVQISRAAGIHVIAGTQRPSAKILSGDIKNNFPCRIAMKMPTRFDSETILGENGAETLLGKGDMLLKQDGSDVLKRFHGPFVNLTDIEAVIHNLDDVRRSMEMMK
jgi:DNA segregation ATPase FtsK/SpoIIIE, S-DNA-T family